MRKPVIVIVILVGVLLIAGVIAVAFVDVNSYRPAIQAQLEHQLNRKVALGQMNLKLLPLRFQVENLSIGDDLEFSQQEPFVRAEKLSVYISLMPLLHGNVQIDSLDLARPSVELIKNKQGAWNFESLGRSAGNAPAASASPGSGPPLTLRRLTISDGQVGITDLNQGHPRTAYDHIDLTLLDYSSGTPFSFDIGVHLPGQGTEQVHLKGKGGPIADKNPADTPFEGELSLQEVGVAGLKTFLDTDLMKNAEGSLSGRSSVRSQDGRVASSGNIVLNGARLNTLNIGYPITLDYDLASDTRTGVLDIKTATLKLGNTPLTLAGTVDTSATPPQLNLHVQSGDVSIAEVGRLASAFGVAFAPGTEIAGRFSSDVQIRGSAANPALNGKVAARDLKISGNGIPQPVEVPVLDLTLTPTEVRSNDFNVRSGKTTVSSRFALKQYNSKSPAVDVSLKAPGATLPEIQSISKAYGITGLDQISGSGLLNLDMHAAGPLDSIGSNEILKRLNGNLNLNFDALHLSGFDMTRELATIAGVVKPPEAGKAVTDIIRLAGQVVVKDGIAQTSDLQVQTDAGNLSATGTADLIRDALDLRVMAVFSKAFSDKVGATRAGGYMNTALANDKGELVVPAIVTGTMEKPKFSADMQAIARLQRDKYLPNLDNPKAMVSDLLRNATSKSDKDEKKDEAGAESEPQKPKDAIKGLLKGFLNKKKPSNP